MHKFDNDKKETSKLIQLKNICISMPLRKKKIEYFHKFLLYKKEIRKGNGRDQCDLRHTSKDFVLF